MKENNVLVIGTGTIGLPLIGLLARFKDNFGIDNVFFNKNTPPSHDLAQIMKMIGLGAKLVTDESKFEKFEELGLTPFCTKDEVMLNVSVVIDCTPSGVGMSNKKEYYDKYKDSISGFIAQGSEFGFGEMFAEGIVDFPKDEQFVQIVSCNTHNLAVLIKCFESGHSSVTPGGIHSADFVCLRRSNDISQNGGFVPSIKVEDHSDSVFGTHHARDAFSLLKNEFPDISIYSSAVKLNTQYMHAIRFSINIDKIGANTIDTVGDVIERLNDNKMVALTSKRTSNQVFSFGRDYGLYGRILSQTVVCEQTVAIRKDARLGSIITGLCWTPQDGNSLLSSISATVNFLHPGSVKERLGCLSPYIFQSI